MADHETESRADLPREPIHRLVGPLTRFLHVEAASGVVLLGCTVVALALANSPYSAVFLGFWKTEVGFEFGTFEFRHSLKHLINDGLMAVFFFVIGLEVKRELVLGELRDMRRAALPLAAALGGMIVPAAVYLTLQAGGEAQRGWGIPMATDIAFVVGCMAILGSRVPHGLRVALLSLAIADDIGAILVIAVGYTEGLNLSWLLIGFAALAVVLGFSRLGVRSIPAYTVIGAFVWYSFHESGVHATIAGVLLGLMTPAKQYVSEGLFGDILSRAQQVFVGGGWSTVSHRAEKVRQFQRAARETVSPLEFLETTLHPWVGFVIMPVFALANAGVPFDFGALGDPVALAVILGLVLGKPLGIVGFSWLSVRAGFAQLPAGVSWSMMLGGGFLCGIGFTMALFIAGLALQGAVLDIAKIGVLAASAISAALGMVLLVRVLPTAPVDGQGPA